MKDFKVGMGCADITPPLGTLLFGYPYERPAQKLLDRIFVKATAVRQNEETIVLISAEVCELSLEDCRTVACAIADATGINTDNVLYSCIHTHSAPVTITSVGWGTVDSGYLDSTLIPKSIEAAKEAIASMENARMAIGHTDSYAGINRREIQNGEVILGQNPQGPYTPLMTAIVFKSESGKYLGTIIHFATHPTSAGGSLSISRDWPGYMIDRVEEITGAPCMYINGAEGDLGPRLASGKTTGDDSSIKEIGLIAADDAQKAVEGAVDFDIPELKVLTENIFLPFTRMPSLESVLEEMEKMGDPSKLIEVDIKTYDRLKNIKEMYESGKAAPDHLELKQTVISLGDLAIVPFPFEAFCSIALSLSDNSPYKNTLLFGLTNGCFGYLPTEEQLPYGGYEVDSFRASVIPGFIDSLDKYIVEENVKLLNKLYTN